MVTALAHLKTAEDFSAVIDASKAKSRASSQPTAGERERPAVYLRGTHFAMHAGALPADPESPKLSQQPRFALGVIIPKRWAKRAVTRNTFKRQFYAVAQTYAQPLTELLPGCGLVLRQTSAFAKQEFVSASSPMLRAAVRQELHELFSRLLARLRAAAPSTAEPAGLGVTA